MKKFTLTEKILVLAALLVSLVMAIVLGSVLDNDEAYDVDLVEHVVEHTDHILGKSLTGDCPGLRFVIQDLTVHGSKSEIFYLNLNAPRTPYSRIS